MIKISIKLELSQHVKEFVNIVNRFPYEIDLVSGRHIVDAKSILGIFSLDLAKPIKIVIYDDDCEDLLKEIRKFIVDEPSID